MMATRGLDRVDQAVAEISSKEKEEMEEPKKLVMSDYETVKSIVNDIYNVEKDNIFSQMRSKISTILREKETAVK